MKAFSPALSLFLAVCVAPGIAQTVKPSIEIGTHKITIGLAADQVIAALQRDYAVQPGQGTGEGVVVHKWLVSAGKNTVPIGVVYARGNSISGVEYMLKGRESDSAQDIFDDLYQAASKLSAEGQARCAIETWSGYVAEASLNKAGITFSCGAYQVDFRRIEITEGSGKSITGYMVWESLGITD